MRAEPSRCVDLNADLGEEVTDDAGLLAVVTSANVACGFHAGTPAIMRSVCAEAARRGTYDEGFPDRGYAGGRLTDRRLPGALLDSDQDVAAQAVRLAPSVASLCVHGDSPGAVAHAHADRRALEDAMYTVAAF